MKNIFLCALVALSLAGCASHRKANIQATDDFSYRSHWKQSAAGIGLMAMSGACYGVHETVVHHPNRIPESWNQQWWDGRVSWTNKGTSLWGRSFGSFGSDAKHTFGPIHRWTLYSGAVVLSIGRRRPWWHYALDAALSFTAFSIGFHGTYNLFFHE